MLKKILFIVLLLTNSILAKDITIAVAANVSYAIEKLILKFNETNPNIKIKVILGSSGKLTAQIKNKAPYDLFMSANMKYPQTLYEDKIAIMKPVVYAKGSLAVLSLKKQDFSKGIDVITNESIHKIAIGNPKTAPYGKATFEALKNSKLLDKVKSKLIYGESISQTISYTIMASDIGFISKSSLYSDKMKKYKQNINWIDVDVKLYNPINQGITILKNGQNNHNVKAFYDFILSKKAKKILLEYGYLVQ